MKMRKKNVLPVSGATTPMTTLKTTTTPIIPKTAVGESESDDSDEEETGKKAIPLVTQAVSENGKKGGNKPVIPTTTTTKTSADESESEDSDKEGTAKKVTPVAQVPGNGPTATSIIKTVVESDSEDSDEETKKATTQVVARKKSDQKNVRPPSAPTTPKVAGNESESEDSDDEETAKKVTTPQALAAIKTALQAVAQLPKESEKKIDQKSVSSKLPNPSTTTPTVEKKMNRLNLLLPLLLLKQLEIKVNPRILMRKKLQKK